MEAKMALPPLEQRSIDILQEELKKLQSTYTTCAEILSPIISPEGARALDRINDAMKAIQKEIKNRTK
jgi:hypothetical protein